MLGASAYILESDIFCRQIVKLFGSHNFGIRARALYFIDSIRKLNLRYKTILDAGCAEGYLSFYLAHKLKDSEIVGVDIDSEKIKKANEVARHFNKKNLQYLEKDLNFLEQQKIKADFIYSLDVMIYLKDDQGVLRQFYKCLDKKGLLFIHVPRESPVFNRPKLYFRRFLSFASKINLEKENIFEQKIRACYNQKDLENKIISAGFQIIQEKITFGCLGMIAHTLFESIRSKSRIFHYLLLPLLLFLVYFDILIPKKEGAGLAILAQKQS
ncbi:MAG: class I SAM-dependent methyltransferase [Candidatus Omnitrophica bacterium]|jgi:2-polyprenyl-3-methyl-5-hydroxy-6-metoxy-1,4-benzoquinol methylase|nr:class I SAM-dependent methyltransferase [Candidatus Omnitrophota bacterium]